MADREVTLDQLHKEPYAQAWLKLSDAEPNPTKDQVAAFTSE